jgi:F-type H+-transporting ATPase subunit b
MPQLDPTAFASQVFWLVITFSVLYLVMARAALPRIAALLESREQQISDNLNKARELQKQAEYVEAENNRLQHQTREKARIMLDEMRSEIASEISRQQHEVHESLTRRVQEAEARIAAERYEATLAMRAEVAALTRLTWQRLTSNAPVSEQHLETAIGHALQDASKVVMH